MLTNADLNSMRVTAEEALPETCVLQSFSLVSDGGGGGTSTWTTGGTVACRIAPLGATEREMGDRISADADSVITLPSTATVTTNSRIISGGGTFAVEAIRERSYEVTTRVEATRQTA